MNCPRCFATLSLSFPMASNGPAVNDRHCTSCGLRGYIAPGNAFDTRTYPNRASLIFSFPAEYHAACRYLVRFGSHRGDARIGRAKIAAALWALRTIDREWAADCRRTMLFISGCFPVRPAPIDNKAHCDACGYADCRNHACLDERLLPAHCRPL